MATGARDRGDAPPGLLRTHDLYGGSANVGAVGMTISMIPNYYSERGLTSRAVRGGDPATRGSPGRLYYGGGAGGGHVE